jgi:thiol:disulfide interchange protein DsbD
MARQTMSTHRLPRMQAAALRGLLGLVLGVASAAASAQDLTIAPRAAAASAATSGPLGSITTWLRGSTSRPELLPPDQAFQLSVRVKDANTLIATLTPAKDYYLYRDRIGFSVEHPRAITVAGVSLPRGEPKADPTFGTVEVFHRPFEAVISLQRSGGPVDRLTLRASYQGCNEPLGVCYPPIEKTITVALAGAASGDASPDRATPHVFFDRQGKENSVSGRGLSVARRVSCVARQGDVDGGTPRQWPLTV